MMQLFRPYYTEFHTCIILKLQQIFFLFYYIIIVVAQLYIAGLQNYWFRVRFLVAPINLT